MIVVNYHLLSTKRNVSFFIWSWENRLEEIIFMFLFLFQKKWCLYSTFHVVVHFSCSGFSRFLLIFEKIRFRNILCKISRNTCMFMFKSRIPQSINHSESGHMSDRIGHIESHSISNKGVPVVSIITYVLN